MAITIDGLQIEITENSEKAVAGLDALSRSLERLKKVTGGLEKSLQGVDFSKFTDQMKKLSTALQPLQGFKTQASGLLSSLRHFTIMAEDFNSFTRFDKFALQIQLLANSLQPLANFSTKLGATLNALGQVAAISEQLESVDFEKFGNQITTLTQSLSPLGTIQSKLGSTLNQLSRFGQVTQQLDMVLKESNVSDNILALVRALEPLTTMGKSQLGSALNQLKKLPEVVTQLEAVDIDAFAERIRKVADAMRPLADEMNKVAAGFSAFPARIQRLIIQNERLSVSNRGLSKTYNLLGISIKTVYAKLGVLYLGLKRATRVMADWVEESNKYVENLNLFRVSMRGAADEALEYAFRVRDAFGIDPSEWIRYQAVFQNMATGFGIASDKAAIMSKALTQLGYDLATIFNVDYDIAMEKLESALAGQPRPMREWGFDMSEATLKLVAMKLGIEENVETMTQFEKAQLRFVQLMDTARKQGILGNFAREIHTPANAMRILNQEIKLLKRALGDLLIPILIKVLPYLQAFVKVLTEGVRHAAILMGFELPKIDYSSVEEVSSGFEKATENANKLKNTLAPFDEINLLQLEDSLSNINQDLGIDFSQYDYDFLTVVENRANEIAEKLGGVFKGILIAAGILGIVALVSKIVTAVGGIFGKGRVGASGGFLIPSPKQILIALTDLALIVSGLTLLLGTIGLLMKIPGFEDIVKTGIKAVGDVFKGLWDIAIPLAGMSAGMALLGKVPVSTVALGLANAAIIVGGTDMLITAIGALLSISGFDGFLNKGIQSTKDVFNGIAEIAKPLLGVSVGMVLLGLIPVRTVVLGLANAAIIIDGTAGVITATGALLSLPSFSEFLSTGIRSMIDLFKGIEEIGTSLAATTAGIVALGFATPATVLSGLAGLALVIGGLELIFLALGGLKQIPGFTWLVEEGGEVLKQLGEILGGFAGSLVKGLAVKASEVLPELGENLAGFMTNMSPFFVALKDVKTDSVEAVKKLSECILILTAANVLEGLTSWAVGKKSFGDFGKELAEFGKCFAEYSEQVKDIDGEAVEKSAIAAKSLAELNRLLPRDGGFIQAITGDKDISLWGSRLELFGGHLKRYSENIEGINFKAVEESGVAAKSLAELNKLLPRDNGFLQLLIGEKDIGQWGFSLEQFGKHLKAYSEQIKGIDFGVIENSANAAEALAALNDNIPTDGGFLEIIAGSKDIDKWGAKLVTFGQKFKQYHNEIKGVTPNVITESANAASALVALNNQLPQSGGMFSWFTGDKSMDKWGENLVTFGRKFKEYFMEINQVDFGVITSSTSGINAVIDMAKRIQNELNIDALNKFIDAIKNLGKAIKNLPNKKTVTFEVKQITGVQTSIDSVPVINWRAYASGGFPPTGQFFIAREAGPELVGTIGRRTAVANNDQIVEAVAQGVYEAVSMALRLNTRSDESRDLVINIDGRTVARIELPHLNEEAQRLGYAPILRYAEGGV